MEKKKKGSWKKYIGFVFFIAIGYICGVLMAKFIDVNAASDSSIGKRLLYLGYLIFLMYITIFFQIIIHEAGHLIFGLLSGYSFNSFRIMNFMWVNENNRCKLRKLTIAGTGGQCLMTPPNLVDGKIPVTLYNLGGAFLNIIIGIIALILYFIFPNTAFFSISMLMMAVVGFIFAVMNGVPMRMGIVDNDGYNAFALSKNKAAMRSFWIQLKVNEELTRGIRLKDMPDEWFVAPTDEEIKNPMIASIAVFECNRMMDTKNFKQAYKRMNHMIEIESGMVGIHRSLLICDCIYCELISENRIDILQKLLNKEQKKFMKSMKKFPTVLRSEYAYAVVAEKNFEKAENIKKQFEKCSKTFPYPSEIKAEQELMDIAEQKSREMNNCDNF